MAEGRIIDPRNPNGWAELVSEVAFDAHEGGTKPVRSERGDNLDRKAIIEAAAQQGAWVDAITLSFIDDDGHPRFVYVNDDASELLFGSVFGQPERFLGDITIEEQGVK